MIIWLNVQFSLERFFRLYFKGNFSLSATFQHRCHQLSWHSSSIAFIDNIFSFPDLPMFSLLCSLNLYLLNISWFRVFLLYLYHYSSHNCFPASHPLSTVDLLDSLILRLSSRIGESFDHTIHALLLSCYYQKLSSRLSVHKIYIFYTWS